MRKIQILFYLQRMTYQSALKICLKYKNFWRANTIKKVAKNSQQFYETYLYT